MASSSGSPSSAGPSGPARASRNRDAAHMIFEDDDRWLTKKRIDAPTGTETRRPRMGRHRGARHADAALVAVDPLRHDRLVAVGLCRPLSGLADARTAATGGMLGWTSRGQLDERARRAAAPSWRRCCAAIAAHADRPTARQSAACCRPRSRAAAPPSASTASSATARARRARTGYPNLNDDDWLWGGDLAAIQYTITTRRPQPGDDQTRMSQMPAFGRDGILKPGADRRCRRLCPHVSAASSRPTRRRAAAQRCSPTIAPSAMAPTARATARSARPT